MIRKKLVALTGAGISAESGLQTFRDSDGLWEGYRVEEVATPGAWRRNPQMVLDFYNMRRRNVQEAQPNLAHRILAGLEAHFDVTVVTQNIDDLHERAGSRRVLHLHGEITRMRSELDDTRLYEYITDIRLGDTAADGGQFRPHVVWFEEPVPMIREAMPVMAEADIFVLIGTSLAVYPAAGLLDYVRPEVPKYVIDRRIPSVIRHSNIIPVEMPATEGMAALQDLLFR